MVHNISIPHLCCLVDKKRKDELRMSGETDVLLNQESLFY